MALSLINATGTGFFATNPRIHYYSFPLEEVPLDLERWQEDLSGGLKPERGPWSKQAMEAQK